MLLLTSILLAPLVAAVLSLLVPSRRLMAALNILAFAVTLGLGIALLFKVLAQGVVTEWNEFLSAPNIQPGSSKSNSLTVKRSIKMP